MRDDSNKLKQRVIQAAVEALNRQHYVSLIDVFLGMGLLQYVHVEQWRKKKIPYLEECLQGSFEKTSFCKQCFHSWAQEQGLTPQVTKYLARTNEAQKNLKFTNDDDPATEEMYRTHYFSPSVSATKRQKIHEKVNKTPELVVFITGKNFQCSKCHKEFLKGSFLLMEANQPQCLKCAKLDDLEYVPRGDATLTRRTKKESKKFAVVVQFSGSRKRYERQGILVDKRALEKVMERL